ncbi:MAG: DUF427 domain-containing protein [Nitriliruptor sp.]|nr:MAG: DUF427 domain-containing protein [Nitriliruptor sp.]
MPTASWNGHVIARSDDTVVVEGNHYFPPDSVDRALLRESDTRTHCPWKGEAYYLDLVGEGQALADAAWYYPAPKDAAAEISGHIAFGKGRDVVIDA